MDNHLSRPEVQEALAQGFGFSMRFSDTVENTLMYVAAASGPPDNPVGVVRLAVPLDQLEADLAALQRPLLGIALLAALVVFLLAVFIAARTARPVEQLTAAVDRIASGESYAHLAPSTQDEVGRLTVSFNRMAEELEDKVSRLTEERSRLATILENMADGVIITDAGGTVRLINSAASRLLDISQSAALARSFAEVVRHHQVIELWQQCRQLGTSQVGAVEIERRSIFWQVIITSFREVSDQGYLVIIQDLSRIRRLETIRRDFISNISHELRTPLASLKALTDTLRDGALEDPPAAQRFLDRMETEIDALTQMVQELLELSRIESGQVALRLRPTAIADVLLPPIERLRTQAERLQLQLTVDVDRGLPPVLADVERMQQVVTNLVHNAIKYTLPGGHVEVRAYLGQDSDIPAASKEPRTRFSGSWPVVFVEVADSGIGIPAKDLPRIFERFYKADRARGRSGTGLGLSIARHLVQSHGGYIWATSIEGQGSHFYFSLPAVEETEERLAP
jgi:two-component system phosphate regulon sensor histidine kinase PhoR